MDQRDAQSILMMLLRALPPYLHPELEVTAAPLRFAWPIETRWLWVFLVLQASTLLRSCMMWGFEVRRARGILKVQDVKKCKFWGRYLNHPWMLHKLKNAAYMVELLTKLLDCS